MSLRVRLIAADPIRRHGLSAVLAEAGGRPEDIARLTWYVVDKGEYLASSRPLGRAYRELLGSHYPAMTAVQVAGLVEDGAKVEIEATAVIPEPN